MIDTHIHTAKFSCDSNLDIDKLVKEKNEEDILCITEHIEFEDFVLEKRLNDPNYFAFDKDKYFKEYQALRDKKIYLGVEFGLNPKKKDLLDNFYSKDFDYILGSLHTLDGIDFYEERSVYDEDKISLYNRYYDRIIECLKSFKYVNALAHFDYVSRYSLPHQYKDPSVNLAEFESKLSELFKVMKEEGVVLEINTKSEINYPEMTKILKLYKSLGNDYVVIGSDSHSNETIFKDFDKVLTMIEEVGLKQVYFVKQQMVIA